jgi:hypothetical protein
MSWVFNPFTGNFDWTASGGGMTNPMTTLGDIIYEDAIPAANRLAGNITATKKFLSQTGTGAISAVPSWQFAVDTYPPEGIAICTCTYGANVITGGTASASSDSGGHTADLACDGNVATYWQDNGGGFPSRLVYHLPSPKVATKLSFIPNAGGNHGKDFVWYGSHDGTTGVPIFTGQATEATGYQSFVANNNQTAYEYYIIEGVSSWNSTYWAIDEVQMFETATSAWTTIFPFIPQVVTDRVTTPNTQLILQETGDLFGTTSLYLSAGTGGPPVATSVIGASLITGASFDTSSFLISNKNSNQFAYITVEGRVANQQDANNHVILAIRNFRCGKD